MPNRTDLKINDCFEFAEIEILLDLFKIEFYMRVNSPIMSGSDIQIKTIYDCLKTASENANDYSAFFRCAEVVAKCANQLVLECSSENTTQKKDILSIFASSTDGDNANNNRLLLAKKLLQIASEYYEVMTTSKQWQLMRNNLEQKQSEPISNLEKEILSDYIGFHRALPVYLRTKPNLTENDALLYWFLDVIPFYNGLFRTYHNLKTKAKTVVIEQQDICSVVAQFCQLSGFMGMWLDLINPMDEKYQSSSQICKLKIDIRYKLAQTLEQISEYDNDINTRVKLYQMAVIQYRNCKNTPIVDKVFPTDIFNNDNNRDEMIREQISSANENIGKSIKAYVEQIGDLIEKAQATVLLTTLVDEMALNSGQNLINRSKALLSTTPQDVLKLVRLVDAFHTAHTADRSVFQNEKKEPNVANIELWFAVNESVYKLMNFDKAKSVALGKPKILSDEEVKVTEEIKLLNCARPTTQRVDSAILIEFLLRSCDLSAQALTILLENSRDSGSYDRLESLYQYIENIKSSKVEGYHNEFERWFILTESKIKEHRLDGYTAKMTDLKKILIEFSLQKCEKYAKALNLLLEKKAKYKEGGSSKEVKALDSYISECHNNFEALYKLLDTKIKNQRIEGYSDRMKKLRKTNKRGDIFSDIEL